MFKRIEKLENEVKELKNEVKELKNQLYENLDSQKIKELSKKYRVKIEFTDLGIFVVHENILRLNNIKANTSIITDKHKYIQSNEFERDIKAFLYNRKKEDK